MTAPNAAKYAAAGLRATVFKQTEVGVSYKNAMLRGDLASYRISSSNEVRTVSPGVYENVGRTERQGTEAALTLTPIDDVELGLVANSADAKVIENFNTALVGKQVTGVPRQSVTVTAAWWPAAGWGGSAVDAPNTLF